MMRRRKLTFVFLFNIIILTLAAQNIAKFEWPENDISPIFKEFVTAYNTNDLETLEVFTRKHFEKDYKKNAAYWPSVFRGLQPSGNLPPYTPVSSDKMNSYLKNYVEQLSEQDRFSGSILVAKGDTILFEETYGKSSKKLNKENDSNTSFNIASTTKTFTAMAIAKLAEQGKLKFTDPISEFIPEYPKDIANQVSIHHLLTHTSGIELDDYKLFNEEVRKARSMDDLLNAQITHIDSMNEGRRKDFKVLNKHVLLY